MKHLYSFFFILCFTSSFAQNSRINDLVSIERLQIEKLDQKEGNGVTYIPSTFAEEILRSKAIKKELEEATVLKIYYVYTQYKLNPSFDQLALDKQRYQKLDSYYPFLLNDPLIEWEILEQTGCKDFKEGDEYFHGFVVIHRPFDSEETRLEEINMIDQFLDGKGDMISSHNYDLISEQVEKETGKSSSSSESGGKSDYTAQAEFPEGNMALHLHFKENIPKSNETFGKKIDKWVDLRFDVDDEGRVSNLRFVDTVEVEEHIKNEVREAFETMPKWIPAFENGKMVKSEVSLQLRVSYSIYVKGLFKRNYTKPEMTRSESETNILSENTELIKGTVLEQSVRTTGVYKSLIALDRNKKYALVMDVTGSMTKHIGAMQFYMLEHHLDHPFTSFTFFNDGDNMPSGKKKIGSTGGIYMEKDATKVRQTIKTAMMKGNGGERPENDIEAILHALKKDRSCDVIVLIGDNYSEVKDLRLLGDVKKEVIVIPCSAPKSVRPDYLKIARETGGSMILNGKPFDIQKLEKGDEFFLQQVEYKFTGSDFKVK